MDYKLINNKENHNYLAMIINESDKVQRPDQNKLARKYFNGNQDYVYFDTESIVSQFKEQLIILQNSNDQQLYDISFFDLNQDSSELNAFYDINFKVIGIKKNGFNQYCQLNDICLNGRCDEGTCKCDNNYFGNRCQFEAKDLNQSGQNKLLAAQKWGYFYFNIDDSLNGKQINILTKTQGKYGNLKFFHTFNEYSKSVVPNSYFQEGQSLNSQKSEIFIETEQLSEYIKIAEKNEWKLKIYIGYFNYGEEAISIWSEVQSKKKIEKNKSSNYYFIIIPIIMLILFFSAYVIYICIWKNKNKVTDSSLSSQQANSVEDDYQSIQTTHNNLNQQQIQVDISGRQVNDLQNQEQQFQMSEKWLQKYMPAQKVEEIFQEFPGLKQINECVICYMEFKENDLARRTTCFHLFHKSCLDEWWYKYYNCPTCRKELKLKNLIQDSQQKQSQNENDQKINPYISGILLNKVSINLDYSQDIQGKKQNNLIYQQQNKQVQGSENKDGQDYKINIINLDDDSKIQQNNSLELKSAENQNILLQTGQELVSSNQGNNNHKNKSDYLARQNSLDEIDKQEYDGQNKKQNEIENGKNFDQIQLNQNQNFGSSMVLFENYGSQECYKNNSTNYLDSNQKMNSDQDLYSIEISSQKMYKNSFQCDDNGSSDTSSGFISSPLKQKNPNNKRKKQSLQWKQNFLEPIAETQLKNKSTLQYDNQDDIEDINNGKFGKNIFADERIDDLNLSKKMQSEEKLVNKNKIRSKTQKIQQVRIKNKNQKLICDILQDDQKQTIQVIE